MVNILPETIKLREYLSKLKPGSTVNRAELQKRFFGTDSSNINDVGKIGRILKEFADKKFNVVGTGNLLRKEKGYTGITRKLNPEEAEFLNKNFSSQYGNLKGQALYDKMVKEGKGHRAATYLSQFNKGVLTGEGRGAYKVTQIKDELNKIKNNEDVLDFIKSKKTDNKSVGDISDKVSKILNVDTSVAARRIADLADALTGETKYVNLKTNNKKLLEGANNIVNVKQGNIFKQDLGSGFKRERYEKAAAKKLGLQDNYFANKRRDFQKVFKQIFNTKMTTDEIRNIATGAKYKSPGYSMFVQGIPDKINTGIKTRVDLAAGVAEKKLQELDPKSATYELDRNAIKDSYNTTVKDFVKKANAKNKKGALPVRAFQLSFDPPKDTVTRYDQLPENMRANMDETFNKFNYSYKVPKDVKTVEEVDRLIKTPGFQKKMLDKFKKGSRFFTAAALPTYIASEVMSDGQAMADTEFGDPDTWDMKVGDYLETGATVAAAAPLATKKGRSIYGEAAKQLAKGIFTPLGAAGLTYAFRPEDGYDLSKAEDRLGFEAEAAFSKDLVRQSAKFNNPLVQRALNLGLSPAMAMRAARIATPLGIASLGAEGAYQLYKAGEEQQAMIDAMSPEERENFFAEQEGLALAGEAAEFAAGGRVGFNKGGKGDKRGIKGLESKLPIDPNQPIDPDRRAFMEKMGIGGLGLGALMAGAIKFGPEAVKAVKKATPDFSSTNVPAIVEELYSTIKNFGKQTDYPKPGSGDVKYEMGPYKLEEGPGGYNITKTNDRGEFGYSEEYFGVYRDPETGAIEYEELTVQPDMDGKLKDVDYGVDAQTYREIGEDLSNTTGQDVYKVIAEEDIKGVLDDGGVIMDQGVLKSGK